MAFDKIQTTAIDAGSAPIRGSVNNDDYVFIRNVASGDMEQVLVSDLLAGSAGSIRLEGQAELDDAGTTLTSIVISGDPDNTTITAGVAPVNPSPKGVAFIVNTASPTGVTTEITGVSQTVFDNDQIVWTGTKWSIAALGSAVISVNGRTGNVVLNASDVNARPETYVPDWSEVQNPPNFIENGSDGTVRNLSVTAKLDLKDFQLNNGYITAANIVSQPQPYFFFAPLNPGDGPNYSKDFGFNWNLGDGQWYFNTPVTIQGNLVYHEGFKPSAVDVGAHPDTWVPTFEQVTNKPDFATRWPTTTEVGLGNVQNWEATSAVNDPSTTKYATSAGVKTAYDAAQAARVAPDLDTDRKRKITISQAAPSGGVDGDVWLQWQ